MSLTGLLKILEQYDHVIWDWNGTLLDDVDCCHRTISRLLTNHGMPPITLERYRSIFRFPVTEYYRALGFDLIQPPFEAISREWVGLYETLQAEARLYPGMRGLLTELAERGMRSHILTAAHERDVEGLTARFRIRSCFESIHGLDNHHAGSKLARGRALMTVIGLGPQSSILAGDTDHDAEVALELGIDCVLLDEGHQEGRDYRGIEAAFRRRGRILQHYSRKPLRAS